MTPRDFASVILAVTLLTAWPAQGAPIETWVDGSHSMWGFFNRSAVKYDQSMAWFLRRLDEAARKAEPDLGPARAFVSTRSEEFVIGPLEELAHDPHAARRRFGAYTKLDRAVLEAKKQGVSILFLVTDNIQSDPDTPPTALWDMFRRLDVRAVAFIPAKLPFAGPIYLEGVKERWPTLQAIQPAFDKANPNTRVALSVAQPKRGYDYLGEYEGLKGIVTYAVALDPKAVERYNRLLEALLRADLPALRVFPIDDRVIALTGGSRRSSSGGVSAELRPMAPGAATPGALVITNPRIPLFQDRDNHIVFPFSLTSNLPHIRIGDDPRTRNSVKLVSSEVKVLDRRTRTPVASSANVTVVPASLQAPLVRGQEHGGSHEGVLKIGRLPEPGFREGLLNVSRDVDVRFAVELAVPPEAAALAPEVRKFFSMDPLQQDTIFSPYADPVRVLHDKTLTIPLRVSVPLSFQLTPWQWFKRVLFILLPVLALVAIGIALWRWLRRTIVLTVNDLPRKFRLTPGAQEPISYRETPIATVRRARDGYFIAATDGASFTTGVEATALEVGGLVTLVRPGGARVVIGRVK